MSSKPTHPKKGQMCYYWKYSSWIKHQFDVLCGHVNINVTSYVLRSQQKQYIYVV